MRSRAFGPTGESLPIIGQGTWRMERDDRIEAIRAIRRGIDLGMTHIDTAEMYGSGRVEELLGEALVERRDEVFLVGKVLPTNAGRERMRIACEGSLRRLRTDRLDGYLLHWPGTVPLEETIAGFEELREAGMIRSWGVSNFDAGDLEEAVRIAGEGAIACNQVLYHLEERAIEHEVIPTCVRHGIAVVGYSPFAGGPLPSPRGEGGRVLAEIAEARGATPRQVALAFLTREDGTFAIPKGSKATHVEENAAAGELDLSPADLTAIDRAFPRGPKPRSLPIR
ncbi:MAG: aldo/keto reductase [Candidatus Eisenbacteria bacterium]|nr:aldo/keto reductase [Candidatus Latescibacterota bacterium]MBD3302515.1 aldo/keto reductase [Candidatus Eisenbacteria bacterium]